MATVRYGEPLTKIAQTQRYWRLGCALPCKQAVGDGGKGIYLISNLFRHHESVIIGHVHNRYCLIFVKLLVYIHLETVW